ncbi:MAG: hypothetical protein K940chlam8_00289 [Chlamydiae bacterium]|nr:hypothetical protein [Chlamydiota bacterium]
MLRTKSNLEGERKERDTSTSDKHNSKELCEEEYEVDHSLQSSYKGVGA